MREEQGITSAYQTLTGKKQALYFQLRGFFPTPQFGSVVIADLGFRICSAEGVSSSFSGH